MEPLSDNDNIPIANVQLKIKTLLYVFFKEKCYWGVSLHGGCYAFFI